MYGITPVRADCLTPTLHVASMGSALVVYTLEAAGSNWACRYQKTLGITKILNEISYIHDDQHAGQCLVRPTLFNPFKNRF